MICAKCGRQFDNNAKFCPQCGQPAGNMQPVGGQPAGNMQPVGDQPAGNMQPVGGQPGNTQSAGGQPGNVQMASGQQGGTQPAAAGMGASPNGYYGGGVHYSGYGNPPGNAGGRQAKKKNYAIPIVAVSAAAVLVLVVGIAVVSRFLRPGDAKTAGGEAGPPVQSEQESVSEPDEKDFSQESERELLGYIDQAEDVLAEAYSNLQAMEETEYYTGKFREYADIVETLVSDLSKLQKQASAVSGIDAKLESAGKEYFSMMCDSQKAFYEIWNFMADYFELGENVLFARPQEEDYDTIESFYNDLYAWYQAAKDGYMAISSCPPCMESEWRRFGEALDLNESISIKLYQADQYGDYLRFFSARNMSERYTVVDGIQYDEFLECLAGERDHCRNQRNVASRLAEEIRSYVEMSGERSGYEFEHVRTGKVVINYEAIDTIYPSLYNTYDAFLIVKVGCISGTRKIVVEAEIAGLTQTYKESFTLDSAYRAIHIKPPALVGDLDLSSSKDAQLKVTVSEIDGTLIEAKTFPVTIKSKYDFEWYGDEYGVATQDNILCFLTPEAEAITLLKRQAIEEISNMTGGQMESFVGYQNNQWNNHYVGTYLHAAGIMRALYESGVRYNMDPFSISGSNQHILFPEDVLNQKSGLCIETSLVVASALQSANMHVFLVFPPGHAQVAVEIWNGTGNDTSGTGEYFLIETTALTGQSNYQDIFVENANALLEYTSLGTGPITYYNQEEWQAYLSGNTYIIDCNDAGVLGMTPFAN